MGNSCSGGKKKKTKTDSKSGEEGLQSKNSNFNDLGGTSTKGGKPNKKRYKLGEI